MGDGAGRCFSIRSLERMVSQTRVDQVDRRNQGLEGWGFEDLLRAEKDKGASELLVEQLELYFIRMGEDQGRSRFNSCFSLEDNFL